MKKTQRRRKLYGRARRRQRGGVNCRLLVVGAALATLHGAHAGEPGLGLYLSNYIEKGDWPSSKALGEKLASYVPTPEDAFNLASNTFGSWQSYFDSSAASSDSCGIPPGPPITIEQAEKVVERYLTGVGLGDMKDDGTVFDYNGREFTISNWGLNRKDESMAWLDTSLGPMTVPSDAKFKVVSVPPPPTPEDEDDLFHGGRRRSRVSRKQRRKTLRRK